MRIAQIVNDVNCVTYSCGSQNCSKLHYVLLSFANALVEQRYWYNVVIERTRDGS